MGFDVYGKNPKNEKGKYFRANIWWWPPLWKYCDEVAPEITKNVEYPLSNDGSGLDAQDAEALAVAIDFSLLTGTAIQREEEYKAKLATYPLGPCPGEELKPGEPHDNCIFCDGSGQVHKIPTEDQLSMRPFSAELVKEFMIFCRYSGGFEIR